MRVMVIIKANKDSEAGVMPSEKLLTDMGKFNEELVKAGVMLAGEGLHPSSKGARVKFSRDKRSKARAAQTQKSLRSRPSSGCRASCSSFTISTMHPQITEITHTGKLGSGGSSQEQDLGSKSGISFAAPACCSCPCF